MIRAFLLAIVLICGLQTEEPQPALMIPPPLVQTQGWYITAPMGWTVDGDNTAFLGSVRSPTQARNPGPEGTDNEIRAWVKEQNRMGSASLGYRRFHDELSASEHFDAWLKLLGELGAEVEILSDERQKSPATQVVNLTFKIGTETWRQRIHNRIVTEPKPGMISLVVGSHINAWDSWQVAFAEIEASLGRLEK